MLTPRLPAEGLQRCVHWERCHLCNLKLFVCTGCSKERRLDCRLLTALPRIEARLIDKHVLRPNKKKKVSEPSPRRPETRHIPSFIGKYYTSVEVIVFDVSCSKQYSFPCLFNTRHNKTWKTYLDKYILNVAPEEWRKITCLLVFHIVMITLTVLIESLNDCSKILKRVFSYQQA